MPFHDFQSFSDWVVSNLTWQIGEHLILTAFGVIATLIIARFGMLRSWRSSTAICLGTFILIFMLVTILSKPVEHANLVPDILSITYGDNNSDEMELFIIARLYNSGNAPSGVINSELEVKINGKVFAGENEMVPPQYNVMNKIIYTAAQEIDKKWMSALKPGDVIMGTMEYKFKGVKLGDIKYGDTEVRMKIGDVNGRNTYAYFRLREGSEGFTIFPQLDPTPAVESDRK